MQAPPLEIHDAADIDYEEYAAFQRTAFRDLLARRRATAAHLSADFFRWKYRTPGGFGRIAAVMRGGRIVSSSAVFPVRLSVAGATVTGWHCVDVATLPDERRRGHLSRCLAALAASVPGDDVLFAFPNEQSLGAFLGLGFDDNAIVTTWVMPRVGLVKHRDPRVREIESLDAGDGLTSVRGMAGRTGVDRRSDYLNWRYRDHPVNDYTILSYRDDGERGLCVVRRARVMNREVALVMELLGNRPETQTALLRHAADRAHASGVRMLALLSTSMPLRTALRAGLAPVPSRLLPKRQVLVVRPGGRDAPSLTSGKWFVQTGDWDVF